MIKVRILTGVTAAGAAVLALPSVVGCSADSGPAEDVGTGTANNTQSIAGSGQIALHGFRLDYASTSGGDEFVRVGEKMSVAVGFEDAVNKIAHIHDGPGVGLRAALLADPSGVKLTLKVRYTKPDDSTSPAPDLALAWTPGPGGVLGATSPEFTVPKGTKYMTVELMAEFMRAGIPVTALLLAQTNVPAGFTVFGAFPPNKIALFDTAGADRRTRVVEGGAIVRGSHATISYTDWRLDTIADKVGLDLRIGQKESGNRFGASIVDALGALEYEVTASVSTDGGATYAPVAFKKVVNPAVLARPDALRYAHEADLGIPANAGENLKVAFHVQAFLQVPDFMPGEIQNARYAPKQRVLLKDVWDNNDGKDYTLPLADAP